jgi:hypothetical protein|tara:strand:- start:3120 stop:3896 length:777 start_codon:yes stop_codon:yes gene_type:complete
MVQLNAQWFQQHKKRVIAAALFVVTIVILPFVKDVFLYEYERYREEEGAVDRKIDLKTPGEHERSETATEAAMEDGVTELADSINQLGERWEESYSELSEKYIDNLSAQNEMFKTFAYLEGNEPENNYGVFLESYYGINDRAKMGKVVVDSLIGREIHWALKIQKVYVTDEPKGIFVLLSPIRPVCDEGECPEGFNEKLLLSLCDCDATTDFLQDTREGDYVFLEGKGRLLETEEKDIDYRQRFSPLITKYRYRPHES